MKKFIFYQLKSIQEYCLTFSCCLNAGFSSLFWTNMFTKRLFFYALLFFLALGQTSLYGQKISGAAVQANFGVDADVYANRLQFGGLSTTTFPNTDDWFLNRTPVPPLPDSLSVRAPYYNGGGLNVISQTLIGIVGNPTFDIKAAINAESNTPFEKRMSKPKNTTVGNYLWIDAVYGRDGNATQGNNDSTVFTKTTDKNGQNPATWNLGSGGTPQKNDIVDVFGHLRRDLSSGATGILWGFGGATTMSADGNAHNDFEYFRTDVTFDGTRLINTGPNEGHTAWDFGGANGSPSQRGDLLISIDFENGGTRPLGSVRVWMKKIDAVAATFNAKTGRPFDITGVFDGTSGAIYGYAEIAKKGSLPTDPNAENPDIFAVVNVTADTPGAPWGSLEGPNAKYYDDIKKLQFSEYGINLTALGLDSRIDTNNPCQNLLGTLIVKTRSSSSFTAELKDFAGPYAFGGIETPKVETTNLSACQTVGGDNPEFNLGNGVVGYDAANTKFYLSNPNVKPPATVPAPISATFTPTAASTTIYVRTEPSLTGCYGYGSFTLTVNPNPAPSVNSPTECVGATATFTTADLGTVFSYQWYKNDVIITGATSNSYTTPALVLADNGAKYKVVVTNTTTTCVGSAFGTLTINANPSPPTVLYTAPKCDEIYFSITIKNVTDKATYTVKDKNGINITGIVPGNSVTASGTADITFSNIPAGSGYQVIASVNGCVSLPEVCPAPSSKLITAKTAPLVAPIEAKTESTGFDAYPVPFKDQLTIKYKFDYVSDTKIEVFNAQGMSVLSKTDTNSYLNKEVTLDLKASNKQQQVYLVKLTTNRETITKKVISSK
jgi:hypothetical protein